MTTRGVAASVSSPSGYSESEFCEEAASNEPCELMESRSIEERPGPRPREPSRLDPYEERAGAVPRSHCPGRKPPFSAVKRPALPYKSPIQN